MVTAPLADVVPLLLHAVKLTIALAFRTFKTSAAVARNHDLMKACFIIWKLLLKFVKAVSAPTS